jgi:hypothetical protein
VKAAIVRYRNGTPTRFPLFVQVHMVAARYGQTPQQVREWPADDFLAACQLLGVTGE